MTPNEPPPPFDDDDLINDYYEEEDHFPEEYGDQYMDEFEDTDQAPSTNILAAKDTENTEQLNLPTSGLVGVSLQENEENEGNISNTNEDKIPDTSSSVPSRIFVSPDQSLIIQGKQDLYSFDRYVCL